jgi:hypothetical protein
MVSQEGCVGCVEQHLCGDVEKVLQSVSGLIATG